MKTQTLAYERLIEDADIILLKKETKFVFHHRIKCTPALSFPLSTEEEGLLYFNNYKDRVTSLLLEK